MALSPLFGAYEELSLEELETLLILVKKSPVDVFGILNKALNNKGFMLNIQVKGAKMIAQLRSYGVMVCLLGQCLPVTWPVLAAGAVGVVAIGTIGYCVGKAVKSGENDKEEE